MMKRFVSNVEILRELHKKLPTLFSQNKQFIIIQKSSFYIS